MKNNLTDEEIVNILKNNGVTCRSCWWQEGGLCYAKPCERHENGRSKKEADSVCLKHTSKRSMLEKVFPSEMLSILSEEKPKTSNHATN